MTGLGWPWTFLQTLEVCSTGIQSRQGSLCSSHSPTIVISVVVLIILTMSLGCQVHLLLQIICAKLSIWGVCGLLQTFRSYITTHELSSKDSCESLFTIPYILSRPWLTRSGCRMRFFAVQIYVYVTADFKTQRNHLNRMTLYDKIIQKKEDAVIEEPYARIAWPFAFTDQGENLSPCDTGST